VGAGPRSGSGQLPPPLDEPLPEEPLEPLPDEPLDASSPVPESSPTLPLELPLPPPLPPPLDDPLPPPLEEPLLSPEDEPLPLPDEDEPDPEPLLVPSPWLAVPAPQAVIAATHEARSSWEAQSPILMVFFRSPNAALNPISTPRRQGDCGSFLVN
jgi:hypothetical protein